MKRGLVVAGGGIALVRIAGMGANFALTVVLARTLGPEGLGLYSYLLLFLSLAAVPISNGWSTLLLRATAQAQSSGDWSEPRGLMPLAVLMAVLGAGLLLILGCLALAALPVGGYITLNLVLVFCLVLLFDQLSAIRLAFLRGIGRPVWGQIPETLLRPGLILSLYLILVWATNTANLELVLIALIFSSATTMSIGWLIQHRLSPRALKRTAPARRLGPWFKSANILAANAGLVLLNGYADLFALGLLSSPKDVGIYKIAVQIALLSGFGYTALNMVAMQKFAYLHREEDVKELQMAATFLARLSFLLTLPIPIMFLIYGEQIISEVFGSEYTDALVPTLYLLGVQSINAFCGFNYSLVSMRGMEKKIISIAGISTLFNFVSCFLLIPELGIAGAAISSALAITIWNVSLVVLAYTLIGIDTTVLGLKKFSGV